MANRILDNLIEIRLLMQSQKKVLNVEELSVFTGMSKSFIYKLTANKMIPHNKPYQGAKMIYFNKAEIIKWMTSYRVKTREDSTNDVQNFLNSHKKG